MQGEEGGYTQIRKIFYSSNSPIYQAESTTRDCSIAIFQMRK